MRKKGSFKLLQNIIGMQNALFFTCESRIFLKICKTMELSADAERTDTISLWVVNRGSKITH